MSALAQYCTWISVTVTGSDRLLDSCDTADIRTKLEALGCILFSQDGSGISEPTQAVVVSTAIEETNADIVAARKKGIPVLHRSDILAAIVATKRTIAVAGTSGKSTVTGMIWEFLHGAGKDPSVISGANLIRLEEQGLIGNAYAGTSDILVIEADESDGTLVKYHPEVSLFLNVSKDHKPVAEIKMLFSTLAQQSVTVIKNSDDLNLDNIEFKITFGESKTASIHPDTIVSVAPHVSFIRNNQQYDLPLPGKHNLSNCLAALAVCDYFNCDPALIAKAVAGYKGVKRRFTVTLCRDNIRIIDDFAHNPEKIRAALRTAQEFSSRVIAVFQPHGFGPTRFLKDDLVSMFVQTLRPTDSLYLLPIYYAGGTAQKDISSSDIISLVNKHEQRSFTVETRETLLSILKNSALPGDTILIMGARDPSLPAFIASIATTLQ